jgi:hypothetical protein
VYRQIVCPLAIICSESDTYTSEVGVHKALVVEIIGFTLFFSKIVKCFFDSRYHLIGAIRLMTTILSIPDIFCMFDSIVYYWIDTPILEPPIDRGKIIAMIVSDSCASISWTTMDDISSFFGEL